MIGFVIWFIIGCAFIGLGIYAFLSKREVAFGFWANAKMFPVTDVKKYNHAVGILWIIFGVIFCILGIPLLAGQNSPMVIISVLGVMLEVIITMAVYTTVIEKKFRKK